MIRSLALALLSFSLLIQGPSAFAAKPSLVLAFIGTQTIPYDTTPQTSTSPGTSFGGALTGQFQLRSSRWSLESGLAFTTRSWSRTLSGANTDYAMYVLQIPVGLRWSSKYFTVSGGGYYSMVNGNVDRTLSGATTSVSPETAGLQSADYGAYGTLGALINTPKKFSILTELRYNYGVANMSSTNRELYLSEMQLWIGLRFGGASN